MENAVCADDRCRGMFQFYGVSRSGCPVGTDPDSVYPAAGIQVYPPKAKTNRSSFFDSPVTISRQVLRLPQDFAPLLYLLKPTLKGMPIDAFTYDDFIEATGINPVTGKLKTGMLQCFKLTGPVDGIVGTIQGLNLSGVCAVVLLMKGRITLADAVRHTPGWRHFITAS